jgi:hypothetical protein
MRFDSASVKLPNELPIAPRLRSWLLFCVVLVEKILSPQGGRL